MTFHDPNQSMLHPLAPDTVISLPFHGTHNGLNEELDIAYNDPSSILIDQNVAFEAPSDSLATPPSSEELKKDRTPSVPSLQWEVVSADKYPTVVPKRQIRRHKKTRRGCSSCKRRKVKCSEEHPHCAPCVRNGLRCVYPNSKRQAARSELGVQIQLPQVQAMIERQQGNFECTAMDMRFLDFFIREAYPHEPMGSNEVWTGQMPGLAHSFNFLMHSVLALGAASLVRGGSDSPILMPAVNHHRRLAIAGINECMSRPSECRSVDENDALIAACYAVCFQHACVGETLSGFWITMRTITVVNMEIWSKNSGSRFGNFLDPQRKNDKMTERLQDFPLIRRSLVQDAIHALAQLERLCTDPLEHKAWQTLISAMQGFLVSSLEGWRALSQIYVVVVLMSPEEFQRFCDPTELTLQLLQRYLLALQLILRPILAVQESEKKAVNRKAENAGVTSARWAYTEPCAWPRSWSGLLVWPDDIHQLAISGELYKGIFEDGSDFVEPGVQEAATVVT